MRDKSFRDLLRRYRVRQSEVARAYGVNRSTVSRWAQEGAPAIVVHCLKLDLGLTKPKWAIPSFQEA